MDDYGGTPICGNHHLVGELIQVNPAFHKDTCPFLIVDEAFLLLYLSGMLAWGLLIVGLYIYIYYVHIYIWYIYIYNIYIYVYIYMYIYICVYVISIYMCVCVYVNIYIYIIWGFPQMRVSKNGWSIKGNPIRIDDLEVPLFQETIIYIYIYTIHSNIHWIYVCIYHSCNTVLGSCSTFARRTCLYTFLPVPAVDGRVVSRLQILKWNIISPGKPGKIM